MRPLGYDADWYDNGPGSENFKRKCRIAQREGWTCVNCNDFVPMNTSHTCPTVIDDSFSGMVETNILINVDREEADIFDIADEVISQAYPGNFGWWGAKHIPNHGILRGAIAKAIKNERRGIINEPNWTDK